MTEGPLMWKRAFLIAFLMVAGQGLILSNTGIGFETPKNDSNGLLDDTYDLQSMIDKTSEGGTLYLPAGEINGSFYINRSMNLIGQGNDTTLIASHHTPIWIRSSDVNISNIGFRAGGSCISIGKNYDNILIWGCNFSNCYRGIMVYNSYIESSDLVIKNNSFFNTVNDGIYFRGVSQCRIEHNSFEYALNGVYADEMVNSNISKNAFRSGEKGIDMSNCDEVNITTNSVQDMGVGIEVSFTTESIISDNRIVTCSTGMDIQRVSKINAGQNHLEDLEQGIYMFYSDDNLIHNNSVRRSSGNGIEVCSSDDNIMENCTVTDCATNIDGPFVSGIYIGYNSYDNLIKQNRMNNCGFTMYPYGSTWGGQEIVENQVNGRDLVYIENDKDILIDDNAGQVLLYECRNITIKGQDLSNATFGLYARESRDIHILESKLDDNHYGIYFLNSERYRSISDVSVVNNSIRRTYYQIFLSSNYEMEDIEIRGNTLSYGRYGIDLDAPLTSSIDSIGIEIINNTFFDLENFAMNLISFREVDILGNNLVDCNETLRLYGNYQDDAYWFNVSDNLIEGGKRGFNLTSMNDLLMYDNVIRNTTEYSVKFYSVKDTLISGNTIVPSRGSGVIFAGSSYYQEFKDNNITNSDVYGIGILGPFTGEFRDNKLKDCGFYIDPDGGGNWLSIDLDDSNKVNGRPVFFSAHESSISIPEDPGQVIIKEYDSVHLKDLSIDNTTVGVQLVYCDTYRIENCSINDNHIGVQIRSSYDDYRGGTINRSTFRRCRYDGISVIQSRLQVEECTISDCGYPFASKGRSGLYSLDEDLILKKTAFDGCGVLFDLNLKEDIVNDLMVDNTTVNGRDLTVLDSREEIEINDPAGQIYLIRCHDVTIKDQNLSDSTIGIYSVSSWGLTIENITADGCLFGIRFKCFETEAKGFSVGNSTCNKCLYEGIRVITFDSGFIDDVNFYGVECFGNGGGGLDINRVRNGFFLENSTLSGNGGNGMDLVQYQGGGYGVKIANTSAVDNDKNGMVITTKTQTIIYGNRLKSNGKHGLIVRDAPNYGVKIVKNNMDQNGLSGFYMADYYNGYLFDNNSFSYNHGSGIHLLGGSYEITHNEIIGNDEDGIRITSGNNEVMWNNISLNGGNGLDLRGDWNNIHNNSFVLNSDYGVFIDRYLQENRLVDNYLISNKGPLGQVLDLNGNNYWDDGKRGNFWSDHQSPDADENGIVDDPLVLPGPNVLDRYPQVMVNHPPEFLTDPSTTGMSHVLYLQEIVVFDRNPIDRLKIEVLTGPEFLDWDGQRNLLVGTPLTKHIGSHNVNLSVRDGKGGIDYLEYTLNISNNPVRLKENPVPDLIEGEELIHKIPNINLDDDPLTWRIETTASFLSIGSSDGVLRGTPDDPDLGKNWVRIMVDDGRGATDEVNYTFEVINVNDAPDIITEDVTTAYEDELYWVDYECFDPDPDGDEFSWDMETDADFLKCSEITGSVHGTPEEADIGSYQVAITVTDIHGEKDRHEYTLEVLNVNDAPKITSWNPKEDVKQNQLYSFKFNGTDSDPTDDELIWSMETNATFLAIDSETGVLEGIPRNGDVGVWEIKIILEDGNGGNDFFFFNIYVEDVNDPPVMITEMLPDATEGEFYEITILAEDPDHPPDDFLFEIETDSNFLNIDPETGILSGTPEQSHVGEVSVNITVTDDGGLSTSMEFTFNVINVNDPPEAVDTEKLFSVPEDSMDFPVDLVDLFLDPDGDLLEFDHDLDSDVLRASIRENGILILNPEENWNGKLEINITASDGKFTTEISISIRVIPINDAPYNLNVEYKEKYGPDEKQIVSATAKDPDLAYGDQLKFNWYDEGSVKLASGSEVELDLSPGEHTIRVSAIDSQGEEISSTIEITVEEEDSTANLLVLILVIVMIIGIVAVVAVIAVMKIKKTKSQEEKQKDDFFQDWQPPSSFKLAPVQKSDPSKNDITKTQVNVPISPKPVKDSPIPSSFETEDEPEISNPLSQGSQTPGLPQTHNVPPDQ